MARSNNKDWFYLPTAHCWRIFSKYLRLTQEKYGITIYLFVLMDNHYHMICRCSEKHTLGEAMNYLQKSVSKEINKETGRINHVFGGPYKPSIIRFPEHFVKIYKYVARNPVTAGITKNVQNYPFSTLNNTDIEVSKPDDWFSEFPPDTKLWLNSEINLDEYLRIQSSLKKTEFKMRDRKTRSLM